MFYAAWLARRRQGTGSPLQCLPALLSHWHNQSHNHTHHTDLVLGSWRVTKAYNDPYGCAGHLPSHINPRLLMSRKDQHCICLIWRKKKEWAERSVDIIANMWLRSVSIWKKPTNDKGEIVNSSEPWKSVCVKRGNLGASRSWASHAGTLLTHPVYVYFGHVFLLKAKHS